MGAKMSTITMPLIFNLRGAVSTLFFLAIIMVIFCPYFCNYKAAITILILHSRAIVWVWCVAHNNSYYNDYQGKSNKMCKLSRIMARPIKQMRKLLLKARGRFILAFRFRGVAPTVIFAIFAIMTLNICCSDCFVQYFFYSVLFLPLFFWFKPKKNNNI